MKPNLQGRNYGKWLVISQDGKATSKWLCRCECGNERIINRSDLVNNKTTQCASCSAKNRVRSVHGNFKKETVVDKVLEAVPSRFDKLIVLCTLINVALLLVWLLLK